MAAPAKLPRGVTRYRGRYRVRVDYEGRTHSLGMFDTPTDARAALDITRGQIARGRFVPPAERRSARKAEVAMVEAQSVTLKEWSEKWLAALEANPDRSPATVVSYRSVRVARTWWRRRAMRRPPSAGCTSPGRLITRIDQVRLVGWFVPSLA